MDSLVRLPITPEADPNEPHLAGTLAGVESDLLAEQEPDAATKLQLLANSTGNLAEAMEEKDLTAIGLQVVEDYEADKADRKEWQDIAEEALSKAAQELKTGKKAFPWPGASNINYPVLSTAMLQFNARAYPAVVKGDEAVMCKVIGRDSGKPLMGPDGQPAMGVQGPNGQMIPIVPMPGPDGQMVPTVPGPNGEPTPLPPGQQPQPMWQIPPGAKGKRAQRVADYMNATLFYRMKDWESDTDSLLMQLPVVGCVARKVYYCPQEGEQKSVMVSMLRIIVPEGARSFETSPRVTEEIPDVFRSQISADIRSGQYIDVDLWPKETGNDGKPKMETEDKPRLLLEQHCLIDMDEDGCPEPYIVTVDHETRNVLRIEANFGPDDVKTGPDGKVMCIYKGAFFIKYPFFPHPKGKFYDIGLGHLLKDLGDVIDTAVNQLMDAGTAQTAGGGFIASGVRLQSRGQGSVVRMEPGVYKTVDVAGDVLRNAIVERTLPNVSSVTLQILDMILGAAKDISGIKDVITGEASNQGQVGTTLALIEQGLMVFNAIYKRIFRAAKEEFQLLFDNIAKYGGDAAAQDYANTLDDPDADFAKDFSSKDLDIRPVSDPSNVTKMQRAAKAQTLMQMLQPITMTGGNAQEVMKRVLEAFEVEDVDKIYPPMTPEQQQQQQQDQQMRLMAFEAEMQGKNSKAAYDLAAARKASMDAQQTEFETHQEALAMGVEIGATGVPGEAQIAPEEQAAA